MSKNTPIFVQKKYTNKVGKYWICLNEAICLVFM